jgi:hypothetical protein
MSKQIYRKTEDLFLTLNSNEIVSPTADVECFYIDAPTTEYRRYKIKGDFNNLKRS